MSCHSLLACRVSVEKSADSLMGVPLYVICCFSLVAFNILSLSLIFVSLVTMCLGVFLLGFILPGTFCACWTWLTIPFPMLGKFSTIISSNISSGPFSLSFPPIMWMFMLLMLSQRSLFSCLHFFSFFILYSVLRQWFPPFCPPCHLPMLLPQLFCYGFPLVYYSSLFVCSSVPVQFSSVAQLCLTLCNPMDCRTPGFPVHHQLPELAQTHVHWVGDAIQPSHPLSSPSPPAFNLSQHQSLFQWVSSSSGDQSIGGSASASVLPMNIQDLIPLGWTGWISLQSKGLSRVFSNTTVQKHQFFGAQLSL